MKIENNLSQCLEQCREKCLELYPKTELYRYLEYGLVFLILILIVVGLFIGWKKLVKKEKKNEQK